MTREELATLARVTHLHHPRTRHFQDPAPEWLAVVDALTDVIPKVWETTLRDTFRKRLIAESLDPGSEIIDTIQATTISGRIMTWNHTTLDKIMMCFDEVVEDLRQEHRSELDR